MAAEHGEVHGRKVVGKLGLAVGRGIDVLTVNDPWAKEVENTNEDRNVTTNEMDEGLESTEKVEKTGELQEGLLGLHQKMDQLLEALCGRLVVKHTSSFAGKARRQAADLVERPWDSTPLQEAVRFKKPIGGAVVRWRPEVFGVVKVDGADVFTHVSVVRGPLEGLVGCRVVVFLEVDVAKGTANEMKYRATQLHREQDYEEILAKTRAEEAAEAAVRAAGESKQRVDATQDAMEKAA